MLAGVGTSSQADARGSARREQILDAAASVFAERGFPRATIRDVARTAGIADGTIYNYFDNKAALLLGLLDRVNESERRTEDLMRTSEADPEQAARAYLRHRLDVISGIGLDVLRVLFSELLIDRELQSAYRRQVLDPTMSVAETAIQRWIDRGAIRPVDAELAVRVTAGLTIGFLFFRLLGDRVTEERWDDLPDLIAEILVNGMAAESEQSDAPESPA